MSERGAGMSDPFLLLLHGLGATHEVWNAWTPLLAQRWPGRWLAPDLPGHGTSDPLPAYTFAGLAAALLPLLDPQAPTVVLGHSLGGVVGLALAQRRSVHAVVGLGIKVAWDADELQRAHALAQRPVTWFATRDEAAARYLRVSGLAGLVSPDDPSVGAGLRERDGQWRLALDPAAFGVGAPDMPALLAAADCAVVLARGEHDPMNTDEQYLRLGVPTVTLAGLGHNAHVESPEETIALLEPVTPA